CYWPWHAYDTWLGLVKTVLSTVRCATCWLCGRKVMHQGLANQVVAIVDADIQGRINGVRVESGIVWSLMQRRVPLQ
ncbi:hypothetical protein B0H13DRAFT_1960121, partial [Mycena leptocephala]